VNLGLLADDHHLAGLSPEQRKAAMDAFIRAVLTAVPGARKNSMNAHTFPSFVLGVVKEKGQPVQLVNAFEEPLSNWDSKQRGGWEKSAVTDGKRRSGACEPRPLFLSLWPYRRRIRMRRLVDPLIQRRLMIASRSSLGTAGLCVSLLASMWMP
jgi:hypothetical protein